MGMTLCPDFSDRTVVWHKAVDQMKKDETIPASVMPVTRAGKLPNRGPESPKRELLSSFRLFGRLAYAELTNRLD